ncbi:Outer membrane porin F [Kordia antarctica]|uniref:Outer membrane porin F n=1 Tax=Kordia antarctica TaxID=1218801 RepID=A0A7L4ZLZ4_9FLAO|nr:Outer membrane porin F [Kordia antarctica]
MISCGSSTQVSSSENTLIEDFNFFEKHTQNLIFKSSTDELAGDYSKEIIAISSIIKKAPDNLFFEISGHTDSVGSEELNVALSQKRADKIKELLVKEGCKSSRLVAKGYGETKPLASNRTSKGRKANRRVEIAAFKS